MDIRELIILGGAVLVLILLVQGGWAAWRRHRSRLRMRIEPDLVPEELEEEDWLIRSYSPIEEPASDAGADARTTAKVQGSRPDEDDPENRFPLDAPTAAPSDSPVDDAQPAADSRVLFGSDPIIAGPTLEKGRAALKGDAIRARPKPKGPEDKAPAAAAEGADFGPAAPGEEDFIAIYVLSAKGERFAGKNLLEALRAAGLKYGENRIFHRIDPVSEKAVFSVASAIKPGYFDLTQDCSSPGLMGFMKLPGPGDASAALEDLIQTAKAVARPLGGLLADADRNAFTDEVADGYRRRVADFARGQLSKRA